MNILALIHAIKEQVEFRSVDPAVKKYLAEHKIQHGAYGLEAAIYDSEYGAICVENVDIKVLHSGQLVLVIDTSVEQYKRNKLLAKP